MIKIKITIKRKERAHSMRIYEYQIWYETSRTSHPDACKEQKFGLSPLTMGPDGGTPPVALNFLTGTF